MLKNLFSKLIIALAICSRLNGYIADSDIYLSYKSEFIDKTMPLFISLGPNCDAANHLRHFKWRLNAYPFDWITSDFDVLYKGIKDDFLYFFTDLKPDCKNLGLIDHYGFWFTHDCPSRDSENPAADSNPHYILLPNWEENVTIVREKYLRRIERFNNACSGKDKVIFIRTNCITKQESINLINLIKSKWPNLDFILVVISPNPDFKDPWDIDNLRNFQCTISYDNYLLKDILMDVIIKNDFFN